jgi:hypothetical protein
MSRHPHNRRERFEIGARKGRHRAFFMLPYWERCKYPEFFERLSRILRDTTKLCGRSCCKNPRKNGWNKGEQQLTMQERRQENYRGVEQPGSSSGS